MESLVAQSHVEGKLRAASECIQALCSDAKLQMLIIDISMAMIDTVRTGKKIFFAGNGGSAADAQHMAGEFISRFMFDRNPLPAIALTTDTSVLTAVGNDYGYEYIFSRQLSGLACNGDIFVAYSTSGNSSNIVNALNTAKALGLTTVGMTGSRNGEMNKLCDYLVCVPSQSTPRIQEGHLIIGHLICELVEDCIFGTN